MSGLHPISGCDNPARKADVLFLHGLGGDAFATWRHGEADSTSWPHWFGEDFADVGVWSLGYAASPTTRLRFLSRLSPRFRDAGHSMPLPVRGPQALDLLIQHGFGERPILLVGHSLGGLLAKQILRAAADATKAEPRRSAVFEQTRAVLFLSTPHAGAELASLVNAFKIVFGASVSIEDLRAHDAHLGDLFNWYRNHADAAGIHTKTYYEQRETGGLLIVNPTSAHPGVGDDPIRLDEDHLSIAKPRSRGAQVYCAACDLLREHVLVARPAVAVQGDRAPSSARPPNAIGGATASLNPALLSRLDQPRVPCELPPAAESFVGREPELARLIARLRAGESGAVVGPAGLGKTALAAAAVRDVVGTSGDRLAASPFPDGVVFLDLYAHRGGGEATWNSLANKLRGYEFMERAPARARAEEACRTRRLLVIIEGGEEADGQDGRVDLQDLSRAFC